ncbi:hypothetical protein ACFQ0K_12690 [Nocardioides caeni]|uniref:hypothetical protein n=1 Tax=Nocardioides caeni TaxID=574700 RepID=UPI001930F193|nr:hypothetical protein [Nocardioides caeni]
MTTANRARRLAALRIDAQVPCPVCAEGVKGANLDRHLAKVHGGDGAVAAGTSGSGESYESVDVRVGSYLQLCSGRRRITVHARAAGPFRTTWTGWEQGPRRRSLDLTLDRAELVALQLALWELGHLAPAGGAGR